MTSQKQTTTVDPQGEIHVRMAWSLTMSTLSWKWIEFVANVEEGDAFECLDNCILCRHNLLYEVKLFIILFSSVALHVQPFATPWTSARQASLSITKSRSPPKPISIELVMPSNHLILCCPLLLPSIFPSNRVSSFQVAKVLEFQLQNQSFQWTPRTYLLQDGLVGSPCSPRDSQASSPTPQFKSINSLVLSFLYSPTLISIHDHWKNQTLTRWTFVDKVVSLLFNMLSRLIITFLPRSKSFNFMAAVSICNDFGAQENKVWHCFQCFPIYLPWSDGTGCHDLCFLNVDNTVITVSWYQLLFCIFC